MNATLITPPAANPEARSRESRPARIPLPRVPARVVFWGLLMRDVRVLRRELGVFVIRTSLQPLLLTMVFGYLLPRMGLMRGNYAAVFLPGILAITMTLAALQAVALPMVTDFGFMGSGGEIEDRLLAPAAIQLVAIEKMVFGVLQGMAAALFVLPIARLIMGPIVGLTLSHALELAAVVLLGATAFSALGLVLGTAIPPQQIGFLFSVILFPMVSFGCVYYPWAGLNAVPVMKVAVLIDPMVYVSEGLRGALTPRLPHMSLIAVTAALLAITAILTAAGMKTFTRRAIR